MFGLTLKKSQDAIVATLESFISMLKPHRNTKNFNNPYNNLRYKAERLRNMALQGKKINDQDLKDLQVSFSMLKSVPIFGIKVKKDGE